MLAKVLFAPVAKVLLYFLERDRADRSLPVLAFSTATTLLASALLYFTLTQNPYSSWLKLALVVLLLLSGLSGEVLHRMAKASEVKRTLDSILDFAVYFTALYFLPAAMYPPQPVPWVTRREYMLLFLLLAAGAVLYMRLTRLPWLRTRSERLLIFAVFLIAGIYTSFETALLASLVFFAMLFYLSAVLVQVLERLPRLGLTRLKSLPGMLLGLGRRLFSASLAALGKALSTLRGAFRRRPRVEVENLKEEFEEPYRGHRFTVMVTDEMENPVQGARVVLQSTETMLEEVRISDAGGRCTFEGISPGEYRILISGEGIVPEEHERYISMDHGEVFTVKLKSSDLSVVVSRRELGTPVRDALVVVSAENFRKEAKTNNLGVAYFDSLEIREYLLEVQAQGYRKYSRPISLFAENVVAVPLEPEERKREPQEEAKQEAVSEAEAEPAAPPEELAPEEEEVIFGESALIEYTSDAKLEEVVAGIVKEHVANDRDVFLVSMQPRTSRYRRLFSELITQGRVRVINLATGHKLPESDSGIEEVPISNLEYFSAVFEEMPAGALFIFEPLSSVVLTLGAEHAYRFVSRTAEHLSNEGLFFICFVNREMHSSKELSSFRELFMNVAEVAGGRIRKVR